MGSNPPFFLIFEKKTTQGLATFTKHVIIPLNPSGILGIKEEDECDCRRKADMACWLCMN